MIATLVGSNSYLVKAELQRLVDDFVATHTNEGVVRLDAEETSYEQITDVLTGMSLFSEDKLVIVSKPFASKDFVEHFEKLIDRIPESTSVILVEPKPDKRTAFWKLLQKQTTVKVFDELSDRELPAWLERTAKDLGAKLPHDVAQYLVSRVGAHQQQLAKELEKLALYDPVITKQTIDLLVEPSLQASVFDMLDAALAGKPEEALRLYDLQRQQRVEPQMIIGSIAWQLHVLALLATAGDRSADVVAAETKIHPFVIRKNSGIAKRLGSAKIASLVAKLQGIDIQSKTIQIDTDQALRTFLLSI